MSMPLGEYFIGDLCYVLHDRWRDFCNTTIKESTILDGEMSLPDGTLFASYSTAYGDGTYEDGDGVEYPVDAGMIGCIKVSDLDKSQLGNIERAGRVVTFDECFSTSGAGGVIRFGNISIDTN